MSCISINSPKISQRKAFIYCIYSKSEHLIYIGQTYSKGGALKRLSEHLSDSSFYKIIVSKYGIDFYYEIKDLNFFYYKLPDNKIFESLEPCYREAVEFNLQLEFRYNNLQPYLKVISNMCNNSSTLISDPKMKTISKKIFETFTNHYKLQI